jgi:hypothetical protein
MRPIEIMPDRAIGGLQLSSAPGGVAVDRKADVTYGAALGSAMLIVRFVYVLKLRKNDVEIQGSNSVWEREMML